MTQRQMTCSQSRQGTRMSDRVLLKDDISHRTATVAIRADGIIYFKNIYYHSFDSDNYTSKIGIEMNYLYFQKHDLTEMSHDN